MVFYLEVGKEKDGGTNLFQGKRQLYNYFLKGNYEFYYCHQGKGRHQGIDQQDIEANHIHMKMV